MIDIQFSADRPADADVLVFPVGKGGPDAGAWPIAQGKMVADAARSARFEGKAGQSFSTYVDQDGSTVRILLVGTGSDGFDKAGGAISAQLLTSGAQHAAQAALPAPRGCARPSAARRGPWRRSATTCCTARPSRPSSRP